MKHSILPSALLLISVLLGSCNRVEPFVATNLHSTAALYEQKTYRDLHRALDAPVDSVTKFIQFNKGLTRIPPEVYLLKSVNVLEFTVNEISILPEKFARFQYLQHLYLRNNHFDEFPQVTYKLAHLKTIDLGENRLTRLPETIDQLQSMEQLLLKNNRLSDLPEALFRLEDLRILNLNFNQLTSISDTLSNLRKLEKLMIRNNNLTEIPAALYRMDNLTYLEISQNNISKEELRKFAEEHPHMKVAY